ncbi:MAG TPA: class III extradiol ring-cleavage dioxygenase [Rhodopila sp.]|nr:class III extradiol ring-cleavage dioxygenase [Rhodopila sp.]
MRAGQNQTVLPTVYISHGSPMAALQEGPARYFLEALGTFFPRPRAVLVVSSHWETDLPMMCAPPDNQVEADANGFPAALYGLHYNAPGAAELAAKLSDRFAKAGFSCGIDRGRGLDQDAWVSLLLAFPEANVPALQLSLQPHLGAHHHLALGAALSSLREEGVLIIGSGSFVHDTRRFRLHGQEPELDDAAVRAAFATWMDEKIMALDLKALMAYRQQAPYALEEHPTEEHLLPLYVALGGAGMAFAATRLHHSTEEGGWRTDAYAFS